MGGGGRAKKQKGERETDTRPALLASSCEHSVSWDTHKWRRGGAVTQGFPNEATRASGRPFPANLLSLRLPTASRCDPALEDR